MTWTAKLFEIRVPFLVFGYGTLQKKWHEYHKRDRDENNVEFARIWFNLFAIHHHMTHLKSDLRKSHRNFDFISNIEGDVGFS